MWKPPGALVTRRMNTFDRIILDKMKKTTPCVFITCPHNSVTLNKCLNDRKNKKIFKLQAGYTKFCTKYWKKCSIFDV